MHQMGDTLGDTALSQSKTQQVIIVLRIIQLIHVLRDENISVVVQFNFHGKLIISNQFFFEFSKIESFMNICLKIILFRNYNYGQCGRAIGVDLLNNPDLVATNAEISFKTAIWFWMTPQSPKPSCHDVITGRWSPSAADQAAGRAPGYGVITNIINGGLECGQGWNEKVEDRIGFYKRYCDLLQVGYGNNLDCYNQRHFGSAILVDTM